MDLQPTLQNELVLAIPLLQEHFELLYAAASDPLIWEQHPNKNRYQLADFTNYFEGAMKSGGAFLIKNTATDEVIGSTRFTQLIQTETENSVCIGYTFYIRSHWGTGHNHSFKKLMINYAFQFVDTVNFHIGATNKRSQISIERLGAKKINEIEVAYYGEPSKLNFVYCIEKKDWSEK
jgi:RimJ/RimL family protein N-acetyltransferase